MDEESGGGGKSSSIKPPMIKPPMAVPEQPQAPAAYSSPAPSPAPVQASRPAVASSNKLVMVINFILLAALIVGLLILAYRWLK